MKILNNTNNELKIKLTDRYGKLYTILLQKGRSTELDPTQVSMNVLSMIKSGELLDITNGIQSNVLETPRMKIINEAKDVVSQGVDKESVNCCTTHPENTDETEQSNNVNETLNNDENSSNKNNSDTVQYNSKETTDDVSVYKCEICGNEFASSRGLTRHMNSVHQKK